MKTRIIIIIILLLILGVLLTRELEDKGHSYLFQKESIEKLTKENRILRKRLLEQTHYIRQVKDIYSVLPHLTRLPVKSISLTSTISYVKLNSFSRIILTKPKQIHPNHIYGLIQKSVVAGIALVHNNQLYGYLTSDEQCRFTVFVGKEKAPGIAIGVKNHTMIVKFIPKWHKIKKGDKVVTSGLDDIFFANLPVGVVTKVDTQSAYKVAYIKTYADIFHPKIFFLINDAAPTLTVESNTTDASILSIEENNTISTPAISSIPQRIDQTQEETIEPEVPQEQHQEPKPSPKPHKKRRKSPRAVPQTLDLF